MEKLKWDGNWPTNQIPADGTLIRYKARFKDIKVDKIKHVWLGIEPVIEMENGDTLFPTLEPWEIANE